MSRKSTEQGARRARRGNVFQERVHDAYKSSAKLRSPTRCPDCGAVYEDGRWQWLKAPADAHVERCPACHRTHDHFPAGYVHIDGDFAAKHRDEIVELVRNLEKKEKAEHALQRVMAIAEEDGALVVTTTDSHLAHGIGEALHRAYKGAIESHYNAADNLARVRWTR